MMKQNKTLEAVTATNPILNPTILHEETGDNLVSSPDPPHHALSENFSMGLGAEGLETRQGTIDDTRCTCLPTSIWPTPICLL